MTGHEPTVFVVDDDEQARKSVCALVGSMGIAAQSFASAEQFLDGYVPGSPGCVVADVCMVGMSGIELQEELASRNVFLPVIILTAYARTPLTVRAVQAGAVTVLEKPYEEDDLWNAIRKALAQDTEKRTEHQRREEIRRRLQQLTPDERKVLEMIVAGKLNKVIAKEMDVSIRTVENRRREVFAKMQVRSVAELVRLAIEAGVDRPAASGDSGPPPS
jgi:FixJ family two-component response regulator